MPSTFAIRTSCKTKKNTNNKKKKQLDYMKHLFDHGVYRPIINGVRVQIQDDTFCYIKTGHV